MIKYDKKSIKDSNKKIGERIKQIRLSKKLKQTVVAKYLGCSKSTFCCYEKGRGKPAKIDLLAEIFGVDVNYFLDDTIYQMKEQEKKNENKAFMERLNSSSIVELKFSDIFKLFSNGLGFESLPNEIKAKMLQKGIFLCTVEPHDFNKTK